VDGIPAWVFVPVWLGILGLARVLTGRLPGVTVFFAAVSALYMLLPVFFYTADAEFFPTILIGCGLAIVGFWLGLTALTGLREPRLALATDTPLEWRRLFHTAAVLITVGVIGVALANPGFFAQVGTYEGRVAFQSGRGIEPFFLNQAVVGLGGLVLLALEKKQLSLALSASLLGAAWAVYSSHKLSLLITLAAWFAWWIATVWRSQQGARAAWVGMVLLPLILPMLILYSFLRAGVVGDLRELIGVGLASLDRLGDSGIMVGDFDGPYRVLVSFLEDNSGASLLGWTYLSQLLVLLPRAFRGDFTDLAETFARLRLGENWRPGMGFAFSPWAEGVLNFGIYGFVVEGLLFGLVLALLVRVGRPMFSGGTSLILYCLIPQIVLFQRGYLIGVVKNVIVYAAPFACVWLVLGWLGGVASRGPSPSDSGLPAPASLAD
jgi:hypothetical protein